MTESDSITPTNATPKWLEDMHKHFGEKGFYRTEDLQRVLGDPSEPVQISATTDLAQLTRNYYCK